MEVTVGLDFVQRSPPMRWCFTAALLNLGCATVAATPAPPLHDEAATLRKVLPAVLLVVTQRPDGKLGYGSGVVVGTPPRVLTNLHVVADATSVRVMAWDPSRTSYIPQQGGLARFLFENEAALAPARLVRGDPELDLAVLDVEGGALAGLPLLAWREAPAVVGEKVLALGHPGETVWSFTSGVVSALHSGVVQTDAAINPGNSGGPLIDVDGNLLGVNTSRLVGEAQGIGFARPIAMARGLLDGVSAPLKLDRSTPRAAHQTCASAAELASETYLDCMDVESLLAFITEVRTRALRELGTPEAQLPAAVAKNATTLEQARGMLASNFRAAVGLPERLELEADADARARQQAFLRAMEASRKQYEPDLDARVLQRTGMRLDRRNPRALIDILRMGSRVERVAELGARAWVEVTGRNTDGSRYRVSELWVRRPDGWREAQTLSRADELTLPPGFALPALDAETAIETFVQRNLAATKAAQGLPAK